MNLELKRLQRMMLRLQKYRLEVSYRKGSLMYICDHLSISPFSKTQKESNNTEKYDIFAVQDEERLMRGIEERYRWYVEESSRGHSSR